jgi:hypothetical protein
MNVIVVDWSGGSFDPYDQAVVNTQVVGAVISELVKALHNTTQFDYSNVHLIGSLFFCDWQKRRGSTTSNRT